MKKFSICSSEPPNEGAGLGLYIVKEAVEKLGGHIELESQIGKGVLFKIELPNLIHEQRKKREVAQMGS